MDLAVSAALAACLAFAAVGPYLGRALPPAAGGAAAGSRSAAVRR